jgi:hypothetical protein
MTKIEKFAVRVFKEHDVKLDTSTFRRVYAGYWQRANGAWSWSMTEVVDRGTSTVGSQWPLTVLLKAPRIDFDGEAFYPENK